jgi:alpha-1,3-rhamnosyl/mannosyltransferase
VIAVGQVNDRKNLGVVLRALARVDPTALGTPALLVAGSAGSGAERVDTEIRRLALQDRVHLAGYVPADELPVLLGAARALVHPSRAEGFGFTPIEAMAAGVPALASNVGALPEMVGGAAELLGPDDVDGWAEAIEGVARDDERAADLVARGTVHQERFRWSRVAEDTERVYAEVLPPS